MRVHHAIPASTKTKINPITQTPIMPAVLNRKPVLKLPVPEANETSMSLVPCTEAFSLSCKVSVSKEEPAT